MTDARRILRYEVPVDDAWHEIELRGGQPLHVAARRRDVVEFWAHHDESLPVTETRRFIVVGTGHPLPSVPTHYHGTALADGRLVWHLLEDMSARAVFCLRRSRWPTGWRRPLCRSRRSLRSSVLSVPLT